MTKFSRYAVAALCAAALFTSITRPVNAAFVLPPAPPAGAAAAGGSGAAGAGIFIGIVALLDIYDFTRRTTCLGDPLKLGGPGFTSAIKPTDNTLPPPRNCPRR